MTIHVLVPVHNRADFTRQFLQTLREQNCEQPLRVVVVDDGSSDHTPDVVRNFEVDLITGDGSWWWAGSIQRALTAIDKRLRPGDFVYLGNNDTSLAPNHLAELLRIAETGPATVVGSVSNEIWPDGTVNPVSAGFLIDPDQLTVFNAGMETSTGLDALAGRGVLLPVAAARALHFSPRTRPQHFADLAATWALRRSGFSLNVAMAAVSTQLERAGSSVEFRPTLASAASKRSSIYLPAMWSFWWAVSTPRQRASLPARFAARGFRQVRSGLYA